MPRAPDRPWPAAVYQDSRSLSEDRLCRWRACWSLLLHPDEARRYNTHDVSVLERNAAGVTHGWGVVFWPDLVAALETSDPEIARQLSAAAYQWQDQEVDVQRQPPVRHAETGFSIGRQRAIDILTERARSLGGRRQYVTHAVAGVLGKGVADLEVDLERGGLLLVGPGLLNQGDGLVGDCQRERVVPAVVEPSGELGVGVLVLDVDVRFEVGVEAGAGEVRRADVGSDRVVGVLR